MNPAQNKYLLWSLLLLIYAAMLAVWGYTFGHENSIQLIPYALHIHDPSLYDQDFFVTAAASRFPNERSFFMFLLYPFGDTLVWPVFILHAITTLLLFRALTGIAEHITGNRWLAISALLLLVFPFNFHTLGLNELISRELTSSLVSDTAAAWAVYMFLKQRIRVTYLLLIVSTLMHPLSGLQVFLLISGTILLQGSIEGRFKETLRTYWLPVAAYCSTALIFIARLQMGMDNVEYDDATFFQSFFVFRNAHHYIPTHFPHNDWVMLTPIFIATPLLLFKKHRNLAIFSILIIVACAIYSYGVLVLKSPTIATAQWFKSTMWLEWFGICAIFMTACWIGQRLTKKFIVPAICAASMLFSIYWLWQVFPTPAFWKSNIAFEFPFYERTTPEIDISREVAAHTPSTAVVIQPASLDEIKYYGRRSGYIDYKALTHTKGFIKEWSARFKEVYQIDPATSDVISFDAVRLADAHFRELTPAYLEHLRDTCGITYIVTFADVSLPFALIAQNDTYKLYQL